MKELRCIICAESAATQEVYPQNFSPDALSAKTFSARRTTENWHYRIVRCTGCGQLFSTPILDPSQISELYSKSELTYAAELDNIVRSYRRPLEAHAQLLKHRGRALEIGCGNGFFLSELQRAGFAEVLGVEPSAHAVSLCAPSLRPSLLQCMFEDAEIRSKSCDLICCFHTLDHVSDPLSFLRRARDLVTDSGVLYFVFHNEQALQARLLGERSPIIDIEHIYLFNPETARRLFQKAGFRVNTILNLANTYSLEYWVRMAPLPAKRMILELLRKARLHRIPLTIPAGNLALFATPELQLAS